MERFITRSTDTAWFVIIPSVLFFLRLIIHWRVLDILTGIVTGLMVVLVFVRLIILVLRGK